MNKRSAIQRRAISPGGTSRRRGSVYLLVLITSMILTVIGLTAVTMSRISVRARESSEDWVKAQVVARAGLASTLHKIDDAYQANPATWRDGFTSGVVSAPVTFESGSFTWQVTDADGDFSDDLTDSFTVTVEGTVGEATYTLAATMTPSTAVTGASAVSGLGAALTCNQMSFTNATVTSDQILHANTSVTANGSTIDADVEAVSGVNGDGSYNGSVVTGVSSRQLPASDVFDYYINNGTAISYASLYYGSISGKLLSPTNNPYGAADPMGIYVIDCGGADLSLTDVRIVGTLVVINVGEIQIKKSINCEPAIYNFPSLITDATLIEFKNNEPALSEANEGTNFNPAGTPFQGETDGDQSDVYPSVIAGTVYCEGNVLINNGDSGTLEGAWLLGGTLTLESGASLNLTYRDIGMVDPPPGFRDTSGGTGPPRVVRGSVRRVVN